MGFQDLVNWRTVFDKDEGSGGAGGSSGEQQKDESGDSKATEIDYSKIDYTKIPADKIPFDILVKHPEFVKVKDEAERRRKTNVELRKRLEQDDSSGKENTADKSDKSDQKENINDPNVERLNRIERMLAETLREKNLALALKQLNVDDKGKEIKILEEKHLQHIKGDTVEDMVKSGKQLIEDFGLGKRNLDSGEGGSTSGNVRPFGGIDITGRMKRKLNNESTNVFDTTLHTQKGGF
jgi:hypothetical protein